MFDPDNDGVDHVNVYSKGKTELGRLLSNFAHTPFEWGKLSFASVEAWWYWHKGTLDGVDARAHLDELRTLHGYNAKKYGQALVTKDIPDPLPALLLSAYQAKADQNLRVIQLLRQNKLPFDHYYVYNDRRQDTRHRWTGQLWSQVKVS